MKKMSEILISCALALSVGGSLALALPKVANEAKADDEEYLYIGTSGNLLGGATAPSGVSISKTDSANTLTFTNYTYSGKGYCDSAANLYAGLSYRSNKNLYIVLVGTNSITVNDSATGMSSFNAGAFFGFLPDTSLTDFAKVVVKGDGKLTLNAYDNTASNAGSFGIKTNLHFYMEESNGTTSPTLIINSGRGGSDTHNTYTAGFYSDGKKPGSVYINTMTSINRGTIEAYAGPTYSSDTAQNSSGLFCQYFEMNGGTAKFVGGKAYGNTSSYGQRYVKDPTINGGKIYYEGGELDSSNTSGESVGFKDDQYGTLTISNNATNVTMIGRTCALSTGPSVNTGLDGLSWTNVAGTGTATQIAANNNFHASGTEKKIKFGGIIKATATGFNGTYDGNDHAISVSVTTPSTGATVKYGTSAGSYTLTEAPKYKNVGTYTTYYQVTATNYDTLTGSAQVIINKAATEYIAPTAKTTLKYTNSAQELVNAGSVTDGSMEYKLGTGTYSSSIPTATDPGDYQVYYKVIGDGNHETYTDLGPVNVTIAPADLTNVSVEIDDSYEYVYNGSPIQPHVNTSATTVDGGSVSFLYSITEDGSYTSGLPSYIDAGSHTIYFKAIAEKHNEYNGSFQFVIQGAEYVTAPSVTVTTGEFEFDGNPHQATVQTTGSTGTSAEITFSYSTSESGSYGEMPSFTDAGTYTVYWKAEATNFKTVTGSFSVVIEKADASFINEPTTISGLHYTGDSYELINAGTSADGEVQYSLSLEGPFSTEIPEATNVGTYTVYYRIIGDANHNDSEVKSISVTISANDKTALEAAIEEAERLYTNIKDGYPEVAETLKAAIEEAIDVYNDYNVTVKEIQDATDALNVAITQAIEDSRDILIDDDSGVSVKTSDGTPIPTNINLKVEVKTNVKAEEGSVEYENIKKLLAGNEKISNVFDIKLIKTEGGVETEIQPSDIKEGMKLIIHISLPKGIDTEALKILHIHNNGEIEFVEGFKVENNEVVFEVSSLSELAFVQPNNAMLPGWAIALIVIGGILLGLLFFLIIMFIFFSKYIIVQHKRKVVRAIKIRTKNTLVVLLGVDCKTYKRPKELVYKTKEEALKVLNK